MAKQYRFAGVVRLTLRLWLRNLLPFTLLSVVLSALLAITLILDEHGVGSTELILMPDAGYGVLVLKGLTALLAPMISARVVQSLDGVDLSLRRSVRLSGRGVMTMLMFAGFGFVLSFVPVVSVVVGLCLSCIGFVAIPAAITERVNPLVALERSSKLSRGHYWTTVALMLASTLVAAIPYGAIYALLAMQPEMASALDTPSSLEVTFAWMQQFRPYALALVAANCVLLPFQGIVRAVSYVLLHRDSVAVVQVFG